MKIFKMEKYKRARLQDQNGDLTKQWRVFYSFENPESRKFERFYVSISNKLKTKTARYLKAKELIDLINKKLLSNWSPFVELEPKYTNLILALQSMLDIIEAGKLRPRTKGSYRSKLKFFIIWLKIRKLDKISAEELSAKHCRDYMDYLLVNRKYGHETYNNHLIVLRMYFTMLLEREYALFNPFTKIKTLPTKDPEIVAFEKEDLMIVINKLPKYNYNLYVIAMLIYYCFLRPAELMRMKVGDFKLDRKTIVVRAEVSKNKKQEIINIPDSMMDLLVGWRSFDYPKEYFLFDVNFKPDKKAISSSRISDAWRVFADKYGIIRNIYDLKHTGAGMCLDNGMNIRDLQMHLRHSSIQVTQKYLIKFRNLVSEDFLVNYPDLMALYKEKRTDSNIPIDTRIMDDLDKSVDSNLN